MLFYIWNECNKILSYFTLPKTTIIGLAYCSPTRQNRSTNHRLLLQSILGFWMYVRLRTCLISKSAKSVRVTLHQVGPACLPVSKSQHWQAARPTARRRFLPCKLLDGRYRRSQWQKPSPAFQCSSVSKNSGSCLAHLCPIRSKQSHQFWGTLRCTPLSVLYQ